MEFNIEKNKEIINLFGVESKEFIGELPEIIEEFKMKWELSDFKEIDEQSINYLWYSKSREFGDVVLKVGYPHRELKSESIALKEFDGNIACEIFAYNQDNGIKLIERIIPGNSLKESSDINEILKIGSEVISKVPKRINNTSLFQTYNDRILKAFKESETNNNISDDFRNYIEKSKEFLVNLDFENSEKYLLHGDLHHMNIIKCNKFGWRIIDPVGVIGPDYMESARFLNNHHFLLDRKDIIKELDNSIETFAKKFEVTKEIIAKALFIMDTLTITWMYSPLQPYYEGINKQLNNLMEVEMYIEKIKKGEISEIILGSA